LSNIDKKNVRYNVLIIIVYLIGILLLLQLFNLQIVHGEEYYAKSSARLTRETTIDAARGDIKDRNGVELASTEARNSLEIYKSKVDNRALNNTILNIVAILEKNKDEYRDSFPIDIKKMEFTIKDEELKNWKEANEIEESVNAEQVLNLYKEKYEIAKENIEDIRKIAGVRYGIEKEGYTSMKPYVISDDISLASVAEIEEQNQSFSGISIYSSAIRKYNMGSLASHILGYIGPIDEQELKNKQGYGLNDYIGKNGVESVFEQYLKGEDRNKAN
jgi:penicillin-binding protein 2